MKLGVVGLPNVGKSTLFNAITNAGAESANYPFCTIEPNIGIVSVPDERLEKLGKLYDTKKITPATIEFVDIAGLVKGASKGEGLGNKFLSHIREVDAIIHVVRCFDNEDIIHVEGSVSPSRDVDIINTELILADMESVEKRIAKNVKMLKNGNKELEKEVELLKRIDEVLNQNLPARSLDLDEDEKILMKSFFLLTSKPVIYIANVDENEINLEDNKYVKELIEVANKENAKVLKLSARIEEELASLDEVDRQMFLEDLGIKENGLNRLVKESYALLGLISYLTAGEKEVRAWTINKGDKAPTAAGKIHSDFERGFIKAEVVDYETLLECGSYTKAKESGKVRIEGKEYVVQDGDVILFRFNV